MNIKDLSWKLFETTGSVNDYLIYKSECDYKEGKEETALGDSPDSRCNNQGNQIRRNQ